MQLQNTPRQLDGWGRLAKNVTSIAAVNNLPLHVYSFERLKENATYEMEKVLNFLEHAIDWKPDNRYQRLKCLEEVLNNAKSAVKIFVQLQKAATSFKREKTPPSFEYYSPEMIEIGNRVIHEVHKNLLDAGFDVFDVEEYLRSQ